MLKDQLMPNKIDFLRFFSAAETSLKMSSTLSIFCVRFHQLQFSKNKKFIAPSDQELKENIRSRSAKLRILKRL